MLPRILDHSPKLKLSHYASEFYLWNSHVDSNGCGGHHTARAMEGTKYSHVGGPEPS
ncbi:MAG: hypothetical protein AMXMBFR57_20160 [Acidimicrobiia bacterium]